MYCASIRARESIWSAPSSETERRVAAPPRLRAVEWLDARLQGWGARGIIVAIAVLWILVLFADFNTGPQLSFTLFYLIPIGLAAWYLSWRAAIAMAVFGTVGWFVGDIVNGIAWTSQPIRYWNTAVRAGVFVVVAYSFSMLRYLLEHERELARTDSLTGVSNWRHFSELSLRELSRARRYRKPISLAYIDVDNFKKVNDTLGHEAGNIMLRDAAQTLEGALRLTDIVARAGGDEFVVLLPDQDQDGAAVAVGKVQHELEAFSAANGGIVSFSIGVITAMPAPFAIETMVQAADRLMYDVKAAGKSGCRYAMLEEDAAVPAGSPGIAGGT